MPELVGEIAVAESGYEWFGPPDNPHLRPARGGRIGQRAFRIYDPFRSSPALFREFARIAPNQGAIAAFARQYGNCKGRDGKAWPLDKWLVSIEEMALVVQMLDAVSSKDERAMRRIVSVGSG